MDEKTKQLLDRIQNDFVYHPPGSEAIESHEYIRRQYLILARYIAENCPHSRELSLSLTSLEESMFWANASIARNNPK